MVRFFKIIGIGFGVVVIALAVLLGGIYLSRNRIKAEVVNVVRSGITTELRYSDQIDINLFADLPRISVGLNQVYLQESGGKDTLLAAQGISVTVDVWNMITGGAVVINGIKVNSGQININRNGKGVWNYKVWKVDEADTAATSFTIDRLWLNDTRLTFSDRISKVDVVLYNDQTRLSGLIKKDDITIDLDVDGRVELVSARSFISGKVADTNLEGALRIKNGNVSLTDCEATIDGTELTFLGSWTDQGKTVKSEMRIGLRKGNLTDILSLWGNPPEKIASYNPTGVINTELVVLGKKGKFSLQAKVDLVEGAVRLNQGSLTLDGTTAQVEMSNVNDPSTLIIQSDDLSASLLNSHTTGTLRFANSEPAEVEANVKGTLAISDLIGLANLDSASTSGKGELAFELIGGGKLGTSSSDGTSLGASTWKCTASGSGLALTIAGIPPMTDFDLNTTIDTEKGLVAEVQSGSVGSLNVSGRVDLPDMVRWINQPDYVPTITGKLNIGRMDTEVASREWIGNQSSTAKSRKQQEVKLDLDLRIDQFIYRDFSAENITCNLHMAQGTIVARQLDVDCLGGHIKADVNIAQGNLTHLGMVAELKGIDVKRLFREWDNFGQSQLTHQHLKGAIDAQMVLDLDLDKDLKMVPNSVRAETDLTIQGGELIGFEPLKALSKFIDVKELEHVKFKSLNNHFTVSDGRIAFPYMTLRSSAIAFDVYGEQAFNGELDYHVNLLLSDLLGRKARKRKEIDGHEILEKEGRTRLFLWLRGRPGDLKVGFDQKEVRKKLANDMKEEGKTVRQLFKDEFGKKLESPANPTKAQDGTEPPAATPSNPKKEGKGTTEGNWEIEWD